MKTGDSNFVGYNLIRNSPDLIMGSSLPGHDLLALSCHGFLSFPVSLVLVLDTSVVPFIRVMVVYVSYTVIHPLCSLGHGFEPVLILVTNYNSLPTNHLIVFSK